VNYSTSDGTSILHSMLLTVERRLARGLAVKLNYTLQKSLDDAPQTSGAQHQNQLRNPLGDTDMYGPSDFDRTHRIVGNFVWQVPTPFASFRGARWVLGGWELTGIAVLQTGSPTMSVRPAIHRAVPAGRCTRITSEAATRTLAPPVSKRASPGLTRAAFKMPPSELSAI
jgi:hypothetical protein